MSDSLPLPKRGQVYRIRPRSDNGYGSRFFRVERRRGDVVYVRDQPDAGRHPSAHVKTINVTSLLKHWQIRESGEEP